MIRLDAGVQGTNLAILVQMLARANGRAGQASAMAKVHHPGFPAVAETLARMGSGIRMTDISTGDSVTPGWASELAPYGLDADFVQAVRVRSVIDRLTAARRAPFLTDVPVESGPPAGGWVGVDAPLAVGRSTFNNSRLQPFKAGVIVVLARELVDSTAPASIAAIRESLVRGVADYLDAQFLDPSVAAVTDVNPAAITNGATQVSSTGSTAAAMTTDFASMIGAADDLVNPVWVMRAKTCATIAGTLQIPGINVTNGFLFGIPILCTKASKAPVGSPQMPNVIALVDQDAVLLADEGQAEVAVSNSTMLQQKDNPSSGAQTGVSMFQTHAVAVKVVRRISYKRTRTAGVVYMESSFG